MDNIKQFTILGIIRYVRIELRSIFTPSHLSGPLVKAGPAVNLAEDLKGHKQYVCLDRAYGFEPC